MRVGMYLASLWALLCLVDWGYRSLAPDERLGVIRAEAGVPIARWQGGMLGAGPSATWYWATEHQTFFDTMIDDAGEDQEGDSVLDPVFRTLVALVFAATLDAATSPFTSIGDHGHGVKIRPTISLRQELGDGCAIHVSHDFRQNSADQFSGTTVALEFVRTF